LQHSSSKYVVFVSSNINVFFPFCLQKALSWLLHLIDNTVFLIAFVDYNDGHPAVLQFVNHKESSEQAVYSYVLLLFH